MLTNFFQVLRYLAITVEKNVDQVCGQKKHADLAITVTVIGEGLLYRGFLIEPILVPLEHIFDPKNWDFFKKMIFSMFDKSAGSADINEKSQGRLCITYFDPNP